MQQPQRKSDGSVARSWSAALTIRQSSEYTGLSRSFLYKLFEKGKLPRMNAGKRVLIYRADLDRYLASLREVGNE
jgi:excisionase family DNA binding protein